MQTRHLAMMQIVTSCLIAPLQRKSGLEWQVKRLPHLITHAGKAPAFRHLLLKPKRQDGGMSRREAKNVDEQRIERWT